MMRSRIRRPAPVGLALVRALKQATAGNYPQTTSMGGAQPRGAGYDRWKAAHHWPEPMQRAGGAPMPEQARGPSGPHWDGVNITWSRAADPGGSAARDDLPA